MEKEKQISLEGRDVELGAAIRYDYHPGGEFGEACDEEYINVFRGDRHIFVARYYDEGDPTPKYMITETDLKTNEQRSYRCDLRSESTLSEAKAETLRLEKKAMLDSGI